MDGDRAGRRVAGLALLAAGLLHAKLSPEHFEEWWGYGAFFVAAAACQVVVAVALLSDAFRARDAAAHAAVWDRRLLAAAILGNLALLAVYAVSRMYGVPWLGPEAGEVEPVAVVDVVTKALEAVAVAALVWSWRAGRPSRLGARQAQGTSSTTTE